MFALVRDSVSISSGDSAISISNTPWLSSLPCSTGVESLHVFALHFKGGKHITYEGDIDTVIAPAIDRLTQGDVTWKELL